MASDISFLKFNTNVLQLGAMYKLEPSVHIVWRMLHFLWRVICNAAMIFIFIASILDIKTHEGGEFGNFILNYVNIALAVYDLLRINYYYISEHRSQSLVKKLNGLYKYRTDTGLDEKDVGMYIKIGETITKIWIISTLVSAELLVLVPVVFLHTERTLPMPAWFPYDWTVSPNYEISCVILGAIEVMMPMFMLSSDCFYSSALLLTVGQFELLGWELKNVLYSALLQNGISKETVVNFRNQFITSESTHEREHSTSIINEEEEEDSFGAVYEVMNSPKFNKDLRESFNKLIKFHQALIPLCEDLENFFAPILLALVLTDLVITAFIVYYVLTARSTFTITFALIYLESISFQLLFSSYFAQLLFTQSEKVLNDLYDLPWYLCNQKIKTSFLLVQNRMKTPTVVTVGKFTVMGYNTFVTTMKTCFSYGMVLYQLTE